MNRRIMKKRTEKTLYPFGKRLKNRNKNLRVYFKYNDIPNHIWIFWYDDGRVNHWGIGKEDALDIIYNGFYVGEEKVDTYVITDLDLHIIAEGGEWSDRKSIQIYGRFAQVGGYYIVECNGKEQRIPKRPDGGRYIDLKTKKAYDWNPEKYGEESGGVSLIVCPELFDRITQSDLDQRNEGDNKRKAIKNVEFHWGKIPRNIIDMLLSKMKYGHISGYDKYGKKIYYIDLDGNEWYDKKTCEGRKKYEKYKRRGRLWETWKEYDEDGNLIHCKEMVNHEYIIEEHWWDHDENGNMTHHRDDRGNETWQEYDKNGNMIHKKSGNWLEQWNEYDENNKLTSRIESYSSKGYEHRTEWKEGHERLELWKYFDKEGNLLKIVEQKTGAE